MTALDLDAPTGRLVILTPGQVEMRLMSAIRTLDALADPEARYLYGATTIWSVICRDFADIRGAEDAARSRAALDRYRPTPEEIDMMMPALYWITPEVKDQFWLLRARAYDTSYRQIARARGRTGEFWRRAFRKLIGRLTANANYIEKTSPTA